MSLDKDTVASLHRLYERRADLQRDKEYAMGIIEAAGWNEAVEAARLAALQAGVGEPSTITLNAGAREAYQTGATSSETRIAEAISRLKR